MEMKVAIEILQDNIIAVVIATKYIKVLTTMDGNGSQKVQLGQQLPIHKHERKIGKTLTTIKCGHDRRIKNYNRIV
jgi:Mg2+/citrate symporter